MTRFAIDGRYLGPLPSGIGRYTESTVQQMRKQHPGHEWAFVVRGAGDAAAVGGGNEWVFNHEPYGPPTSLWLGRKLGRRPGDLFHSPFHVLPRGLDCAAVLTLHDTFNFEHYKTSNYGFPINYLEWAYFLLTLPASLRRADRVVCVSQTTADDIIRRMPELEPKIRVIHHGVAECFKPLPEERQREILRASAPDLFVGADGDPAPYFLSLAGISPNKNHVRMIQSYAKAIEGLEDPPRLVCVSRYGQVERLRKTAREAGVLDHLVSLEAPADDVVGALLSGARSLLFCSFVEGFGLPILEAMACGCPVLTSTISCMPEIAGGAALLVDPYDLDAMASAMRRLALEPTLRDDLAARGIERAAKFTWERTAELHWGVYQEALSAR